MRSGDGIPACVTAALAQHPATDRDDQAGLLGDRDEVVRWDQTLLGMAPAQQSFDAGHGTVLQPDHRLVVELELVGDEGALEVVAQLEPGHDALVHGRLEQPVAALAVALGDVHGRVGVADQLLGVTPVSWPEDRDADAAAEGDLPVPSVHRLGEQIEDALRRVRGRLAVADVVEQHGELVAAEASGHVRAARAGVESARELDEHLVAGRVAQRVIDRLEVVEVDEDHRRGALVAPSARDRLTNLLREHRAVGEAGDGIVKRLMGELCLERLAFAHVAGAEQDAADVLVVAEVREQDLEVAAASVAPRERALERRCALACRRGGHALREPVAVAGDGEAVEALTHQLLRLVAEDALARRALVGDGGVGVEHRDEVARVAYERREPGLAAAPVHFLAQHGAVERERDLAGQRVECRALCLRRRVPRRDHEQRGLRTPWSERHQEDASVEGREPAGLGLTVREPHMRYTGGRRIGDAARCERRAGLRIPVLAGSGYDEGAPASVNRQRTTAEPERRARRQSRA